MKTFLEKIRSHRSLLHWAAFSVIMLGSFALYFTARADIPWLTTGFLAMLILANLLAAVL